MRDIGERAAVNESWRAFQRLHQIGGKRFLQEHGHGALRVKIARADRLAVPGIGDDDIAEPIFQIVQIARQAEDRHHFGGDGDVKAVFARKTVGDAAKRRHDRAQRPVVHIEHAAPGDAPRIDAERVAEIDVIVDQGGEQIVRRSDGVKIAGEVQVDVLHRYDLGVAAAGSAALHAERWAERRLTDAQHRLLADVVERVGKPDRGGGLALAGRRRIDRAHQDELAVWLVLQRFDEIHRYLGLVMAVGLEIRRRQPKPLARDVDDRPFLGGLRNFNIGFWRLVLRGRHWDGSVMTKLKGESVLSWPGYPSTSLVGTRRGWPA